MPTERPLTLAIAGATGFVGQSIIPSLSKRFRLLGLTRSKTRGSRPDETGHIEWRRCDLFSLLQLEETLHDADVAIYLVHSMLPSSRLTQGHFADLDLLMADNFGRAARTCGVQQIIYLGGLLPKDTHDLSPHLRSRWEVEQALGAHGVPVTSLRAGLVVGPGGSSLKMLVNLVKRLPAMALPKWTSSQMQPIAIQDVVRAFHHVIGQEAFYGRPFDIGGPEVMTYAHMLRRTARILGVDRPSVGLPVFSPRLSRLWISMISGSPQTLVGPLIESLRHEMVVEPNPLQAWLEPHTTGFDDALRQSLNETGELRPNPRAYLRVTDDAAIREAQYVRSIQRLPLPRGRTAQWAAYEYLRWLPRFLNPFLRATVSADGVCAIYLKPLDQPLLVLSLSSDRSHADRPLFYITGGLLVDASSDHGRLEFREVLDGSALMAGIHDFRPRLPWHLYNATQALLHLWVMRSFGIHLQRVHRAIAPAETVAAGGGQS
ncbi:MAG: NAD-dependent epimerase/dehydratase family protein [Bacteroidota bacterium]